MGAWSLRGKDVGRGLVSTLVSIDAGKSRHHLLSITTSHMGSPSTKQLNRYRPRGIVAFEASALDVGIQLPEGAPDKREVGGSSPPRPMVVSLCPA